MTLRLKTLENVRKLLTVLDRTPWADHEENAAIAARLDRAIEKRKMSDPLYVEYMAALSDMEGIDQLPEMPDSILSAENLRDFKQSVIRITFLGKDDLALVKTGMCLGVWAKHIRIESGITGYWWNIPLHRILRIEQFEGHRIKRILWYNGESY